MVTLTPDIKKLLSLTDLVLLDIKHINSYTGYNEKHHLVMHPRWGDTHVAFF